MPYYIAPYIGSGGVGSGEPGDDVFRPAGTDGKPDWSAIDLRRNSSKKAGSCLLFLPDPDLDPRLEKIAEAGNESMSGQAKDRVRGKLFLPPGRDLPSVLKDLVADLLLHPPLDAWKPLRPSRVRGRFEIYLGPSIDPLLWTMPLIRGGTTITESFNKANSDILGPDLSWTELAGDIDVVSNKAQSTTLGGQAIARADSDLATDDHYAQAIVDASEETNTAAPQVFCRKDSTTAITFYLFLINYNDDTIQIYEVTTGSFTLLGSAISFTLTAGTPVTLRGSVDGSSLEVFIDGVSKGTRTDTVITGNLRCGIRVFKNSPGFVTWENFQAGDLAFTMAADAGVYSLAGSPIVPDIKFPAASGVYSKTGSPISPKLVTPAASGAYNVVGSAVSPKITLPAASGVYTLTGSDANLLRALILLAESGIYNLVGSDVLPDITMPAASGVYSLVGSAVLTKIGFPASSGVYLVTGSDANLLRALIMLAESGVYSVVGSDATLLKGFIFIAESGVYSLTGSDILTKISLPAAPGVYVITGSEADLIFGEAGGALIVPWLRRRRR